VNLNRLVAFFLRAGVTVGAALALVGLVLWAAQGFGNPNSSNNYDFFSVLQSASAGNAAGIAYLGIVILLATPIFRVALSIVYFGAEKDMRYVIITAAVLAMLLFALFQGRIA